MADKNLLGGIAGLKSASIMPGAVFIGPWEEIDHDKFIVIAGVTHDKVLACTVLINSRINPYIMRRQKMLDCQVYVKSESYNFLSHDSFVNCAQPMIGSAAHFVGDEYKYCGLLNEPDLVQVRQSIVESGLLTDEEIESFGL
ncbi:MAG: hypothetical protein IJQ11_14935 [Bacteroidales bacterium]|nr:hypothetical protein [Bacteroidales bacterium]